MATSLERGPVSLCAREPGAGADDDLSTLDGYHSPQVQVSVRLNTNESPVAPPAAWVRAYQEAVADIDWHRYPERSAGELRDSIAALHGVRPDQVFAANGSNEVLQTILLAYAGPGRTVVTFEPTYQLHSHIARITGATVVSGDRSADFTLDVAEIAPRDRRGRPVGGVPLLAEQPDWAGRASANASMG